MNYLGLICVSVLQEKTDSVAAGPSPTLDRPLLGSAAGLVYTLFLLLLGFRDSLLYVWIEINHN